MSLILTEDHRYLLDDVEILGLTSTLHRAGLVDDTHFTEYARERGSNVHLAIKFWLEGDLDEETVDLVVRGYLAAAQSAIKELAVEPLIVEEPTHSDLYRFGCTPDIVGRRKNGIMTIVEWKTGPIHPWVAIQTAGQEVALEEHFRRVYPGGAYTDVAFDRFAVQLGGTGEWHVEQFTNATDRDVFLASLALVNWKTQRGMKP